MSPARLESIFAQVPEDITPLLCLQQMDSGITMDYPFIKARTGNGIERVPCWLEESSNPMPTRAEVAEKVQPNRHQNLEDWQLLPRVQKGKKITFKAVCVRSFGNRIAYASLPNGGCLWTLIP